MRKLIALFLALALALGVTSALADQTVTVTGTGEVYVDADTAVVSIGVSLQKKDALTAQSEANKIIAKIREALTGAGFSDEDINTGYINLYPVYDYMSESERIVGYSASSTLSVKVTDIARVGEAIDLSFGAGANTLDGISFSVSDDTAARTAALKEAVANAQAKAAVLAEAAGLGSLAITSVQESGTYAYTGSSFNTISAKGISLDESGATVVQASKILVSATVVVTFEAKAE